MWNFQLSSCKKPQQAVQTQSMRCGVIRDMVVIFQGPRGVIHCCQKNPLLKMPMTQSEYAIVYLHVHQLNCMIFVVVFCFNHRSALTACRILLEVDLRIYFHCLLKFLWYLRYYVLMIVIVAIHPEQTSSSLNNDDCSYPFESAYSVLHKHK